MYITLGIFILQLYIKLIIGKQEYCSKKFTFCNGIQVCANLLVVNKVYWNLLIFLSMAQ